MTEVLWIYLTALGLFAYIGVLVYQDVQFTREHLAEIRKNKQYYLNAPIRTVTKPPPIRARMKKCRGKHAR
jgi:hypothetical protein